MLTSKSGLGAAFQDGPLQAGEGPVPHPDPPPRRQPALDRQRGAGGDQLAELAEVEDELLGVFDRQDAGDPVGGEGPHPLLFRSEEEDVAAKQGHLRGPPAAAGDARSSHQRQIEGDLVLQQLPGQRLLLPGLGVQGQPAAQGASPGGPSSSVSG